jgi:hypothetical protein
VPQSVAVVPTAVQGMPSGDLGFGEVLPYIDTARGVSVASGEGLLVIEADATDATDAPEVQVGDRKLGRPPIAIALPPGRHELLLRRGAGTSFRYVILREGETRVVSAGARHR